MMHASVVIPHFEDPARLRRCLEGLANAPEDTRSKAEVVVVDNGSVVDMAWVERDFPFVRFVVEADRGAAAARNRGVGETSAPRIAFLDCDCVPAPDWLVNVVERPVADVDEVVGGEVTTFDETPPPRSGPEAFETVFAFNQKYYIERKGFSVTANMVTSRVLFERIGAFRGGLSEDVEWCRRAVGAGARMTFDPSLSVSHPTRRDWPSLRRKWIRTTREAFGTGTLGRSAWVGKALLMPVSAAVHAPRVLFSRRLGGVRERLRGLATLIRLRLARGWWMLLLALGADVT